MYFIVWCGSDRQAFRAPNGDGRYLRFGSFTAFLSATGNALLRPSEQASSLERLVIQSGAAWSNGGAVTSAEMGRRWTPHDDPSEIRECLGGSYGIVIADESTLLAFNDPAGLQPIYYGARSVANYPPFISQLEQDWELDAESLIGVGAIGYKIGEGSSRKVARSLPRNGHVKFDGILHVTEGWKKLLSRGNIDIEDSLEAGIEYSKRAIQIATEDQDEINLPITGGKDSRMVLSLCIASGLKDRLRLYTAGNDDHPDVVSGRMIADSLGIPHRTSQRKGSQGDYLSLDEFQKKLERWAIVTDGIVGAWDIAPTGVGETLIMTGHVGEVYRTFGRRDMKPDASIEEMVRLQSPFDPFNILTTEGRGMLEEQIAKRQERYVGYDPEDLPDLFYYMERIPNWLGPYNAAMATQQLLVMPLYSPPLLELALALTAKQRKMNYVHFRVIRRTCPQLLYIPFAQQTWSSHLSDYGLAGSPPQIMFEKTATSSPVRGTWQWTVNSPDVQLWIRKVLEADLPIWKYFDQTKLMMQLSHPVGKYHELISLLGLLNIALATKDAPVQNVAD